MSRFVLTAQLQLQAPTNVGQIVSQIQNQLNGINVNLQVQGSAQAQRQIQQVTQSCNNATSAAGRMGQAFAVSIRRFAAFSIATRAVGLFTSTLSDAIQTSIDFERQLIKLSQVTGDGVGKLRDLTNTITGLSVKFGVSSQSLLETTTALIQAGISSKDTKVALDALAQSALAPNFDSLSETTEGAIAILAQFKQGVGALEGQLSSINAVAGAFAVEASDLIDVVRRTGGVFKSSGGDLNELLALFTSVRATTRESAESIGTGLRTIFTRIQRPKTIEFLKQFGVELVDLNGKFVGPYEAVRKLSDALSGLGEGDVTFIRIAEELGGFRQIGKVLPLLQEFSTAQSALNVATNANNSLSKDAATAQAALAVRITKVKEEFLALVRGITETSTFQIMANTALNLASALIKIADAIKPLLPLLTAVAAVNIARGLGSFAGNLAGGLRSGRTFNQGGRVHRFATGGLVPGVGNSDTVPAMLSPGEFVIRKSSVQSLGASNLAGMNSGGAVQRFAAGGLALQKTAGMAVGDLLNTQTPDVATPIKGSASINSRSVLEATPGVPPLGNLSLLKKYGGNRNIGELTQLMTSALGFNSRSYSTTAEGITKTQYDAFNRALGPAIENAVIQSAGQLAQSMGVVGAPTPTFTQDFSRSLPKGLIGSLFEIILDTFNDRPISGSETRRPFDFTGGLKPIGSMYAGLSGINYVDAKVSPGHRGTNINQDEFTKKINNQLSLDVFDDFVNLVSTPSKTTAAAVKTANKHFGGLISKFATGGGAGSDTVPAMLTPGEFVVNRSSAQRIGYSNLSRMNKIGKYANGGIVQHFATGGVTMGSPGSIPGMTTPNPAIAAATSAATAAATASTQASQSIQQVTRQANQFGIGLSLVTSSLSAMLPPITENSNAMAKMTNSILTMATTIGGVVFALESMGVAVNASTVSQFFGTGANGLGSIIKNFGTQAQGAVGSLVGKMSSFGNVVARQTGSFGAGVQAGLSGKNARVAASVRANPLTNSAMTNATTAQRLNAAVTNPNINPALLARFNAAKATGVGTNLNVVQKVGAGAGGVLGSGISTIIKSFASVGGAIFAPLAAAIAPVVAGLIAFAGPILAIAAGVYVLGNIISSMRDLDSQIKKAVEAGDSQTAQTLAVSKAAEDAVGGLLGWTASLLGAEAGVVSFMSMFGGPSLASVKSNMDAQVQAAKTQKALSQSAEAATKAMEEFERGNISATDALRATSAASKAVEELKLANEQANRDNTDQKSTGGSSVARNIFTLGGLIGENSGARNARIDKENKQRSDESKKAEQDIYQQSKPAIAAFAKDLAVGGGSVEEFMKKMQDEMGFAFISANGGELRRTFENLSKEIEINRKAFAAMNLGLSSVNGAANATVLKLNNFVNGLEAGASPMEGALATLEAGITGAAQGISDADFGAALSEASDVLYKFGASGAQVTKFQGNVRAVNNAQKNSAKIFADVKSSLSATGSQSADTRKKGVIDAILKNSGLAEGSEELNNFRASLEKAEIDLDKLAAGDVSVFETALKDLGENAIGQAKDALMAEIQVNKQLVALTKQRIDAERNLVEAQKEALQLQMEGREVQAKYGGTPITNQERRANILGQANAGAGRLGLSNIQSGSIAELQQRRREITNNFGAIEASKRTEGALNGPEGATAAENQKDLAKASKEYVQTVRDLIKAEEDNLKTIEAKNKLEKDSMESLMSGDIEKFFQQQAAVGATAAIATGNQSLIGAFGAEALGGANSNIQRMQEAGVQEIYGQRISGAGGLGERSAQSALRARGITDPRAAQVAAGTTAEEEASKSRLRALGGELSASGQMGVDMAQMELQTATMNLEKATIYANSGVEIVQDRQIAAAGGYKANGGLIYAAMGKFIPRGTDTVPAMLTPGEFVVRRDAVNRGNNLALLQAINTGAASANNMVAGFAKGGRVQYFDEGSKSPVSQVGGGVGLDPMVLNNFSEALNNFNKQLTDSITTLSTTKFKVTLDTTNVNVNLTGGSFLMSLKESLKEELLQEIGSNIQNYEVADGGKLRKGGGSVLPRPV